MKDILNNVITEATRYVADLLDCQPDIVRDIPKEGGVYVIYKNSEIIYIGEARNLRRRILDDHLGGDIQMSTSTLRRSVHRVYGIPAGAPVRDWMRSNCKYAFVVIPDHDTRDLVEKLAILTLRKKGNKLLNFYRE